MTFLIGSPSDEKSLSYKQPLLEFEMCQNSSVSTFYVGLIDFINRLMNTADKSDHLLGIVIESCLKNYITRYLID